MRRVIAAGCCCPLPGILEHLPEGAVWMPTPGGYLGSCDEVAHRFDLVDGHDEDDLILVTSHGPCPSNPDDAEAYALTESYVESLLQCEKRAVGIFLGKSMTLINPGQESDPLVHQVFYGVSDAGRFWKKRKPDPKAIGLVKIAPYFEKETVAHDGVIHLSTIFPMTRAITLLKEWGGGVFPLRQYSERFQSHQVEALEAQFA